MSNSLFYGLVNGGATCWLNATYQSFISLDPFMKILFYHALEMPSYKLVLAHAINLQLTIKLFHYGSEELRIFEPVIKLAISRADEKSRELWFNIVRLIQTLADPDSFYANLELKKIIYPFPLVTCALINFGRNSSVECDQYADPRSDAALRLFGALVVYCGATNARPVPEYRAIGEVSPAMFEIIIGAICWELGDIATRSIRSSFCINVRHSCLCTEHASELIERNDNILNYPAKVCESQICIQVVPSNLCTSSFVSNVQCSIDISEKNCDICRKPGVIGIETREHFGPIIAIITDDSVARGLTYSNTSSIYRRSPIGQLYVPSEFTIITKHANSDHWFSATYYLAAQIIQEGGHFTACISRMKNNCEFLHAYISDQHVSKLANMVISPACSALFYCLRTESSEPVKASNILSCALNHSIIDYINLQSNENVIQCSGMVHQHISEPQNITELSRSLNTTSFKNLYITAMKIHIKLKKSATLSINCSHLETLFSYKVGAKFCTIPISAGFDFWNFYTHPEIVAILTNDNGENLRIELEKRLLTQTKPFHNLRQHPTVINHPEYLRIVQLIDEYTHEFAQPSAPPQILISPSFTPTDIVRPIDTKRMSSIYRQWV